MGKIKDLLIQAADYRCIDVYCEFEEGYEWAVNQEIDFLINYVKECDKRYNDEEKCE